MLQARRLAGLCAAHRTTYSVSLRVRSLYHGADKTLGQKTDILEMKDPTNKKKSKSNVKPTSIITSTDDQIFKELRGKVIALRARELRILTGNLINKESGAITNPAQILNLNSCTSCGRHFKTPGGLKVHSRKCKSKEQKESNVKVANALSVKSNATDLGNIAISDVDKAVIGLENNPGNLVSKGDEAITNPAQVLNANSCTSCGRHFKTPGGLKNHSRKCKGKDVDKSVVGSSTLEDNPDENGESNKPTKVKVSKNFPIVMSYFDVLVNTQEMQTVHDHFKSLKSLPEYKEGLEKIEFYNVILRGWARKGELSRILELWREMNMKNIEPDINSYIASIIAFSAQDPSKNVYKSVFKQIYEEFKQSGHTVDLAFKTGWFQADDRKLFLRSLQYFSDEAYHPVPEMSPCTLDLLKDLPKEQSLLKSQVAGTMTRDQLDRLFDRQSQYELNKTVKFKSIIADRFEISKEKFELTENLVNQWRNQLTKKLNKQRNHKLENFNRKPFLSLYAFLDSVPVSSLVDIAIELVRELLQNSETFSMSSSRMESYLGNKVMHEYIIRTKLKDNQHLDQFKKVFSDYLDWYVAPERGSAFNHKQAFMQAMQDFNFDLVHPWPGSVISMAGREIKELMINELFVTRDKTGEIALNKKVLANNGTEFKSAVGPYVKNPVLFRVYRMRKDGKSIQELKPHPLLAKLFANQNMKNLTFDCRDVPMVCPPMPWLTSQIGAHYYSYPNLVRMMEYNTYSQQMEKLKTLGPGALDPVLDAANQLGSMPWKVHQTILDLAIQKFVDQKDEKLLDQLSLPLHPDSIDDPVKPEQLAEQSAAEIIKSLSKYNSEKQIVDRYKRESYSLWCDAVYRLSIANHFRDDILWFPHFLDFRGRVYPIPPHLNHMGNDLARSLLVFAKGKPLGPNGLKWLKLHCINLTGLMKRDSVEDRLKYVEDNLHLILDSATNLFEGECWFLKSEDPWQTLAVCIDIKGALECPEGPENFISHLPIHQDGSCNGLQHYAAIGRDKLGAAAVNLIPADRPQDVYSEIAAIVERKREEDAAQGLEIAKVLEGFVRRKVVKQTVMTTVYGVTQFGATKQIAKQLKDISEFPQEHVGQGSKYLSKKTFESLNELFTSSQEIQQWLTECAGAIAGECASNVEWTTPLGLPVEQPYTNIISNYSRNLNTETKHRLGKMSSSEGPKMKVNGMKHRNGFAPNFVHSLDSTHMMLTSLHLWRIGVDYATVHDCYWTHACDVEKMNKECRNQFVALHSSPILEDLSQSFIEKFLFLSKNKNVLKRDQELKLKNANNSLSTLEVRAKKRETLFNSVPKKGDLDLNVVKDSVYFFS